MEGRLYTGKKIRQIWAESAVHVDSYLQICLRNDFCFHKKLTFYSCILILYGSCCWFTHSILLPFGTRFELLVPVGNSTYRYFVINIKKAVIFAPLSLLQTSLLVHPGERTIRSFLTLEAWESTAGRYI